MQLFIPLLIDEEEDNSCSVVYKVIQYKAYEMIDHVIVNEEPRRQQVLGIDFGETDCFMLDLSKES